ncbi:MAG: hypothetical protein IPL24_13885 [Bacteroidetes bacterium]|nr:hypothetical protein [Bacteroidota bacterium]
MVNVFPTLYRSIYLYIARAILTLSTMQSASSYIWNTGDTTEQLHVTTSGNYSVILTDSLGQSYSVHSVPLVCAACLCNLSNISGILTGAMILTVLHQVQANHIPELLFLTHFQFGSWFRQRMDAGTQIQQ